MKVNGIMHYPTTDLVISNGDMHTIASIHSFKGKSVNNEAYNISLPALEALVEVGETKLLLKVAVTGIAAEAMLSGVETKMSVVEVWSGVLADVGSRTLV